MITELTNKENYTFNRLNSYLFNYLNYLIKDCYFSQTIETYLMIIEMIQMISFTFNPVIHSSMVNETLYKSIYNVLESFCLVSLFKEHQTLYFIFFYSCVVYIFLYFLATIGLIILLKKNSFKNKSLLYLMQINTKAASGVLFIPLFSNFNINSM